MAISKKTKKVKGDSAKSKYSGDGASVKNESAGEDNGETVTDSAQIDNSNEDVNEIAQEDDIDFEDIDEMQQQEKTSARKFFGKKPSNDRSYGDEPTFGSDKEAEEDLKETLKSMLPDDNDDDDDEDFEFIDLD